MNLPIGSPQVVGPLASVEATRSNESALLQVLLLLRRVWLLGRVHDRAIVRGVHHRTLTIAASRAQDNALLHPLARQWVHECYTAVGVVVARICTHLSCVFGLLSAPGRR